jgi:hypothetical protein
MLRPTDIELLIARAYPGLHRIRRLPGVGLLCVWDEREAANDAPFGASL